MLDSKAHCLLPFASRKNVESDRRAARFSCRAAGLRRMVGAGEFEAPPGPSSDAVRLLLNIEIVAAKAFQRDRLFVEYHLKYDDKVWECGEGSHRSRPKPARTQSIDEGFRAS